MAFVMAIFVIFCGGLIHDGIHGPEHNSSRFPLTLLYGGAVMAGVTAVVCVFAACCLRPTRVQPVC